MKKSLTLSLLLLCLCAGAQVFPVQVMPQITPPYSPYLSDYTAPGSRQFTLQVRANDVALANYACKLRITIEGVGITLRTKQNLAIEPLILAGGGGPQLFYGDDLQAYFHPDALDFSGLSKTEYAKYARLPEGVYRFTVEILDYNRGTVVSNKGMAVAWIVLNDPPILNTPANFTQHIVQDPTNILFSWTPRHAASPNAAFTTEYTFRLIEVWPEDRNPYDAFLTQAPFYEAVTTQSQLLYTMSEPALIPGRKYAWEVQARDTDGKDLFRNAGRSEVFVFKFGEALPVPQDLRMRWAKPTTLAIQWNPVKAGSEEVKYRLQYRPRKRREDHRWYETRTKFTDKTLYDLEANTEYEMKVRTETAFQQSEYSGIEIFKTLRPKEEQFVCRDNIQPPPLPANTLPVFPLSVNDTIHAGGYDVVVRDVIDDAGKYYGSGFAIVPWFNGAKIRATFEGIRVNDRFWLTSGAIRSVWNSESGSLIEEQTPLLPGSAPQAGELDITIVAADSLVTITGASIASVTRNQAGNVVLETTDGDHKVLRKGRSYAIVDETGNGYVVDEKANIAKTTATEAMDAAGRGKRDYDLALKFVKGSGRFGFDEKQYEALTHYYQQLKDGGFVPWKALPSGASDVLEARLTSQGVDPGALRFERAGTPVSSSSSQGDDITLTLVGQSGGMEEELLALFNVSDTIPPKVVGKVNLVTYDPVRYNLEIVPVNGASIPGDLSAQQIFRSLNAVYSQAVVEWDVTISPRLQLSLDETFDEGESGLLSNYTADMKKVLKAFGRFRDNTYYLFLIEHPRNESTLGYMPRNRQAGFVFTGPHNGNVSEFLKTIAHELGHGAFNLKHTFSEHNLPAGITDNVMDYSTGTALYKYQWDYIHDPQVVMGLFEGGEEGESVIVRASLYPTAVTLFQDEHFVAWIKKVRDIYEFFNACDETAWRSYKGSGIIPECFWLEHNISPALHYSNADLAFISGLIDGAYLETQALANLHQIISNASDFPGKLIYAYSMAYLDCQPEDLLTKLHEYEYTLEQLAMMEKDEGGMWNWVKEQWHNYKGEREEIEQYFVDCRDAEDLRAIVEELYQVIASWEEIKILSSSIYHHLKEYWQTLRSSDNIGRYEKGLLIVPTASMIFPLGAASRLGKVRQTLKSLKAASNEDWLKFTRKVSESGSIKTSISNLSKQLRQIYDDCIKAGYRTYEEGGTIFITTQDGAVIAKIANGALQIKIPHSTGWAVQSKSLLAEELLQKVAVSRKVYRLGKLNISFAAEAQYWSPENPFDYPNIWDYASKYGIPEQHLIGDEIFFESATLPPGVPYITREAPAYGQNLGGAIEVVVPTKSVKLETFNMVKIEKQ